MKKQILRLIAGVGIMAFAAFPMAAGVAGGGASIVLSEDEEPKGSEGNPYTVAELLPLDGKADKMTEKWFEGYIVGYVAGNVYSDGAAIGLPDDPDCITNVIIAGSKDETDVNQCIPVQLPYGAVRDALNIYANKENLGKRVNLKGNFELYFSRGGIKKVKEFQWLADDPVVQDYTMYLIGNNVNGSVWALADETGKMTSTADGVWEWSGDKLGSGFKFNDGSWEGLYNIGAAAGSPALVALDVAGAVVNDGDSMNIGFAEDIEEINNPYVVLDLNAMTVTVSGSVAELAPVKLTITIDGGASVSYMVPDRKETSFKLRTEDSYWNVKEALVNDEVISRFAGSSADVAYKVDGDTEIVVRVDYKDAVKPIQLNAKPVAISDNVKVCIAENVVKLSELRRGQEIVVYNMSGQTLGTYTASESTLDITLATGNSYIVRVDNAAAGIEL